MNNNNNDNASIEDSVDASIRLEDYIEKREVTRNNTDYTRTNQTEMARKQNRKKNNSLDFLSD